MIILYERTLLIIEEKHNEQKKIRNTLDTFGKQRKEPFKRGKNLKIAKIDNDKTVKELNSSLMKLKED